MQNIFRSLSLFVPGLFAFFFISTAVLSGQDSTKISDAVKKPRIIFNSSEVSQKDSLAKSPVQEPSAIADSANMGLQSKPKITFKKNLILDENKIELISEDRFRFGSSESLVGQSGEELKKAMGKNFEAVAMVDGAYSKKSVGAVLMGIGGAVAIASIALQSTWVKQEEQQHGNVTVTRYWIPGITIGAIIGAIGYVQFSSLKRNLNEAVEYYNSKLK
ncbi:MAG: hypothetical protein ACM34K_14580 [Bacillota bacterium]